MEILQFTTLFLSFYCSIDAMFLKTLVMHMLALQLQQSVEEKAAVSAQLRAVSQTLRETQLSLSELQNRYYWMANQQQLQHSPAQV